MDNPLKSREIPRYSNFRGDSTLRHRYPQQPWEADIDPLIRTPFQGMGGRIPAHPPPLIKG